MRRVYELRRRLLGGALAFALEENPEIMADVETKVRENYKAAFEKSLAEEEEEE